ncbi:hypothetical protein BDQ17DRAFT_1333613 [Cyathus striatus]|nr:hypothetical protein BDQ17DRAFT_1333613 [Cyathus striatus]
MPRKKHNGKREAALQHEATKHGEIISNMKEHVDPDVAHDPMYDPVSSAVFVEEEPEIDLDVQITPIVSDRKNLAAKPSKFKLERAQLTCEEEEELTDDALDTNITGISEKDCLISLERLESSQSSVDSSTDNSVEPVTLCCASIDVESTNEPLPNTSLQGDHDALESGKDTTNSDVSDVDEGILTSLMKELSSDKFVRMHNRLARRVDQLKCEYKKKITAISNENMTRRLLELEAIAQYNNLRLKLIVESDVNSAIQNWLKGEVPLDEGGFKGRLCAPKLQCYVNEFLFPSLQIEDKICLTTSVSWLKQLGFWMSCIKKGVYVDRHKRPDV